MGDYVLQFLLRSRLDPDVFLSNPSICLHPLLFCGWKTKGILELPRELVKNSVSWAPSPEVGGDPLGDSDVSGLGLHFGALKWTG